MKTIEKMHFVYELNKQTKLKIHNAFLLVHCAPLPIYLLIT